MKSPSRARLPGWIIAASGVILICLALVLIRSVRKSGTSIPKPSTPVGGPARAPVAPVAAGVILAIAAIPLGFAIRKWLSKRRSQVEEEATRLLFGAKSRQQLTETLAIEVDKLVQQLERLDERIVGLSIAIMVDEFRKARKPEARQKALMQMMELMEKIRYRLTPWYVRHDKLIAVVISVLTCLSGVATAIANIAKPSPHP